VSNVRGVVGFGWVVTNKTRSMTTVCEAEDGMRLPMLTQCVICPEGSGPTPIDKPGFVGMSECEVRSCWTDTTSDADNKHAFHIHCTFSFERREDVSDEVCLQVIKNLTKGITEQVIDPSKFHVKVGEDYQRLPVQFRDGIKDGQ